MKCFLLLLFLNMAVQLCVAPPVNQKAKDKEEEKEIEEEDMNAVEHNLEYHRYLKEVVQLLESDPDFREKVKNADQTDIRTGKIADQLQFVNHNVRTRLDEIKREELERLRHLATKEHELREGYDMNHLKMPEHLDHTNTRTFEISDLKKLIQKISKDLAIADEKRREEFKQQEMERRYEEQEKLKNMNEMERKKYEEELHALEEKQKKAEPVHHPGSKQQYEEVWEKQDHMESEEFNPRTFFFFHDLDGNGVWDQDEVKVLFLKELDKLYAQGTPGTDLLRRSEEMERMREHLFNEADLNKDGLISYEEFLEQTKRPDFEQDQGWETLDKQQIYTQEEFESFERHKQEEMEKMISQGMLPPHPGSISAQGGAFPPQYGHEQPAPGIVQLQPDQAHPQYHHQMMMQQNQQQQVPNVQQHIPNVQQQVPNVQQHLPNIQQQVPNVQQHISNIQQQVPNVQQHIPNIQQHIPNMQQQVPNMQQQIPNMQQQIPNMQQQHTVNEVPVNIQANVASQQNTQNLANSQAAPVPVQQDTNRNKIPSSGKV